jgi:hypothetical protein
MTAPDNCVVEPAGALAETIPDTLFPQQLKEELLSDQPPGYFALYDLSDYDPEDVEAFHAKGGWQLADPKDVVVWGLEFPDIAVSVLRNIYSGKTELRIHPSAKLACEFFSERGPLSLQFIPIAYVPVW